MFDIFKLREELEHVLLGETTETIEFLVHWTKYDMQARELVYDLALHWAPIACALG